MRILFSRGVVQNGRVLGTVDVWDVVTLAFRVPYITGMRYWLSVGGYAYLVHAIADFERSDVDRRSCLIAGFDKISTPDNVKALLKIMGYQDVEPPPERLCATADNVLAWSPYWPDNDLIASSNVVCSPDEVNALLKLLDKLIHGGDMYRELFLTRVVTLAREHAKR